MLEIILTFPTPEGTQEIRIDRDKTTFGRGSDADHRFADNGLSRLHATVYRDVEKIWVVDENSANGTFVNGSPCAPAGTPLKQGDAIRIGNETVLTVQFRESVRPESLSVISSAAGLTALPSSTPTQTVSSNPSAVSAIAIVCIGIAFIVVCVSGLFVAYRVLARSEVEIADDIDDDPIEVRSNKNKDKDKDDKPPANNGTSNETKQPEDIKITSTPDSKPPQNVYTMPAGKKYLDLSDTERRQYLADRALKIAQVIGNNSSDAIPAAALDKIKAFADAYAKRVNVKAAGGCKFGDNLQVTYERASKNAPFIVKAFNEKGTDPRIGLYLAMIESEHCICLQSPTGPLGMFQFTKATGEMHGLKTVKGASPQNPDERCEPEPAARAAASYMKALTGRYGTGPSSVPLAIGSYNSGEGGLSSNLVKALDSNSGLPRDFWMLIANGDLLSKQFQSENFKYVPKFFAAAIIGENPPDFGLKLQPLSTYSK